jgi:hypothetical protein
LHFPAVKFPANFLTVIPFLEYALKSTIIAEEIIMELTLQLAIRIAIVWAAGFILAVAVRALLPDKAGFTLTGAQSALFLPFSRVGFWICVLAALTVTALVVFRAMLLDLGR